MPLTVARMKNPFVGYIDNAMKWCDVAVVWENFCCWDEYAGKHKVIKVIIRGSGKGKKYVQINNKNTKMTSMTSSWCFYCSLCTYITLFSNAAVPGFKQVDDSLAGLRILTSSLLNPYLTV